MLKIQKYFGLNNLPQSYRHIFNQAGQQSFFLSFPWFENFQKTVVKQDEINSIVIYGVEEQLTTTYPVAALILMFNREKNKLFPQITMESLSNYYTSHFSPILKYDFENIDEVTKHMAYALWKDRNLWDVINIRPLEYKSSVYMSLVQSFKEAGMVVQTYFCFGNWYLDIAGRSYNEYYKNLPSVLRKNIPYERRKLERAGRVRFDLIRGEKGLEKALGDYEKVYNASWKIPEPYPAFIRGLVQTAMENGWLRLGLLYLNDEPMAAQLWIVHAGVASIYKVCYDQRFSKLSAGTILTSLLMQHMIDVEKVKEVDYLSGDDAYKKNWMSHRRERWGIIAFNPYRVKGCVQTIRHVGGKSVKCALGRVSQLRSVIESLGKEV
jgi:hypothetical protein